MSRTRFMNVKVDADVVRKAKVVAAVKHTTLTRYITTLLRSHVEKDVAAVALELTGPAVPNELSTANCYPRVG
jgi:hypothetical protein